LKVSYDVFFWSIRYPFSLLIQIIFSTSPRHFFGLLLELFPRLVVLFSRSLFAFSFVLILSARAALAESGEPFFSSNQAAQFSISSGIIETYVCPLPAISLREFRAFL